MENNQANTPDYRALILEMIHKTDPADENFFKTDLYHYAQTYAKARYKPFKEPLNGSGYFLRLIGLNAN